MKTHLAMAIWPSSGVCQPPLRGCRHFLSHPVSLNQCFWGRAGVNPFSGVEGKPRQGLTHLGQCCSQKQGCALQLRGLRGVLAHPHRLGCTQWPRPPLARPV